MGPVLSRGWAAAVVAIALGCGNSSPSSNDHVDSHGGGGVDACTGGSGCSEPCNAGNEAGVGKFCTKGGGECSNNPAPFLFCTIDYVADGSSTVGFCTGVCGSDADCGAGATCSGSGMGNTGCVPDVCQ
jgi:hypothetical protein|nr:hypothetical protein [Kofleriaceae bacterium]